MSDAGQRFFHRETGRKGVKRMRMMMMMTMALMTMIMAKMMMMAVTLLVMVLAIIANRNDDEEKWGKKLICFSCVLYNAARYRKFPRRLKRSLK